MGGYSIRRRTALRLFAGGVVGGWGIAGVDVWRASAHRIRRPPSRKPAPPPATYRPIVAIDPGHGGIDPGAISPGGIYEKHIVFAVALDLKQQLERTRQYRPILTRRGDEFVALRDRVARARADHADIFLSIHADSLPDRTMRGLSVFTLSEKASDREAAALADQQNKVDRVAGIDLSRETPEIGSILFDLAQRQTNNLSLAFAQALVQDLGREVVLLDHPHRCAGFAVLTAPDIPSALVETGCLTNRVEERLLQKPGYQRQLADGLSHAIESYFDTERVT